MSPQLQLLVDERVTHARTSEDTQEALGAFKENGRRILKADEGATPYENALL